MCRVLERILSPIRPYSITMITIGNAKKTHVDNSHNGNLSGLSSIAQNAESGISSLAIVGGGEGEKEREREDKKRVEGGIS